MISIIIPCKKRLAHLKQALPLAVSQSYQDIEIIVVDYNCPEGTKDYVSRFSQVHCVEAQVGKEEWNLSASRNLGYKNSNGDKLLFIDADTLLNTNFVLSHVDQVKEGIFLTGKQTNPYNACGSIFIMRSDFEKVKGYNELVQGWGSEDFNLYERLRNEGMEQRMFDFNLIKNIPHSDQLRNQYFGHKNKFKTNIENYHRMNKDFKGI
jgi:glycosyltransferase involved in cell wall biosynthesis